MDLENTALRIRWLFEEVEILIEKEIARMTMNLRKKLDTRSRKKKIKRMKRMEKEL